MIFKALNSSSRFPAQSEFYRIVPKHPSRSAAKTEPPGAQATELNATFPRGVWFMAMTPSIFCCESLAIF
jgi:hypothetical protein